MALHLLGWEGLWLVDLLGVQHWEGIRIERENTTLDTAGELLLVLLKLDGVPGLALEVVAAVLLEEAVFRVLFTLELPAVSVLPGHHFVDDFVDDGVLGVHFLVVVAYL